MLLLLLLFMFLAFTIHFYVQSCVYAHFYISHAQKHSDSQHSHPKHVPPPPLFSFFLHLKLDTHDTQTCIH